VLYRLLQLQHIQADHSSPLTPSLRRQAPAPRSVQTASAASCTYCVDSETRSSPATRHQSVFYLLRDVCNCLHAIKLYPPGETSVSVLMSLCHFLPLLHAILTFGQMSYFTARNAKNALNSIAVWLSTKLIYGSS